MEIHDYANVFVLSMLSTDDMLKIVMCAIESGFDTPSLWQLAGLENPDAETVKRLFSKIFDELGIPLPSPPEAGRSMARRIAQDVINNTITPYEGAKRVWQDIYTRFPELDELRGLVGFASEYEDDINHQEEYSLLILNEFKSIAGGE